MTDWTNRNQDMLRRVLEGETTVSVGQDYGITWERVRQIVTALDPQATKVGVAVRREQAAVIREVESAKRLAANPPCYVCRGPITNRVIRKQDRLRVVCGSRCHELYRIARVHLSEQTNEAHRLYVARSTLAHSETRRASDVRHAERVLAGTAGRKPSIAGVRSPRVQAALNEVARLRVAHSTQSEAAS